MVVLQQQDKVSFLASVPQLSGERIIEYTHLSHGSDAGVYVILSPITRGSLRKAILHGK
jgi:hypothetical protein